MARQFKIEIVYTDASKAEVYIHDNSDIEVIKLPPVVKLDKLSQCFNGLQNIISMCRTCVSKIEVTKVP